MTSKLLHRACFTVRSYCIRGYDILEPLTIPSTAIIFEKIKISIKATIPNYIVY